MGHQQKKGPWRGGWPPCQGVWGMKCWQELSTGARGHLQVRKGIRPANTSLLTRCIPERKDPWNSLPATLLLSLPQDNAGAHHGPHKLLHTGQGLLRTCPQPDGPLQMFFLLGRVVSNSTQSPALPRPQLTWPCHVPNLSRCFSLRK